MTYLLQAGAALLLIAIFGVAAATFALRHERAGGRKALPDGRKKPGDPKADPYAIVWWQNLQDLGYEFHLVNGEVWRGRITWHRYPDGADESDVVPMKHWDKLDAYRRRIEWKEPEIWALHAHVLVDWSPLERAWQLKLLNGSVWQFNTKSEGLGENNSMAWHRISSPEGIVFESLNSIHAALNAHLEQIRAKGQAPLIRHEQELQDAHNRLLVQQRARQRADLDPLNAHLDAQYSVGICSACRMRPVYHHFSLCLHCQKAQGSGV